MEHFGSYIFAIVLFALAEDSTASDKIIFPTINPHLSLSPALLVSPKSCPENIQCVPPIRCPAHLWMLDTERPSVCELGDGSKGLCCTTGQNHTTPGYLRKYFTNYEKYELIDTNSIVEEAKNRFAALNYGKDHHISRREATFQHNLVSGPGDLLTQNEGIQDVIASQAFRDQEDLDVEESQLIGTFAPHVHTCPTSPACHAKLLGFRYRSIDGVCNNPNVRASTYSVFSCASSEQNVSCESFLSGYIAQRQSERDDSPS